MWDLGNRVAVVLISVTCGCLLIYGAWGAILALALTLLLVVYACYSLLANDSLVSPHAYQILGYLSEVVHELGAAFRIAYGHGIGQVRNLGHSASRCYREHFPFRMPKRQAGAYQLSSDPYVAVKRKDTSSTSASLSASRFSSIDQLSPILRVPCRIRADDVLAGDAGKFYDAGDNDRLSRQQRQSAFGKHTSTPVIKPSDREENFRNGDVDPDLRRVPFKRMSPHTHSLSYGENTTQFSPEGSPWGVSISPAMRPRPAGIKTVQTVAGPLLASTRYNIDPKVYTDVTSPGLTTRLTKYATEAKSKLTHQSQYGAGQFPKVNLYAGPVPLLNAKSTKMRMPVTVRVAAPDVTKYSPPERQKILSNIYHAENRSPTSVVQVLKEISLKRHASTEDVSFDAAKKQKTDSFFNEERELILEENKQKRGRDDSSKSEEDLSPQSKSIRPAKRTKTLSCYDILNSLSSSMHVATGVKRKAADFSRSGTPDLEKHFKSLESTHSGNSPTVLQSQNLDTSHTDKPEFKEIYSKNLETLNSKKTEEFPLMKGILKSTNKESRTNLNQPASVIIHKTTKKDATEINNTKSVDPSKFVKLTEKLFMRAEPERNERLKSLVEEPSNVKVKFAIDNVEEIKREDIRNMRRTNMKARLQSMFNAISGKENKINPDVVIQADDINATVTPPVTCSAICATLNSLTTTTNINTMPLSTAAILPSGSSSSSPDAKLGSKPAITFSSTNTTPNTKMQSNMPSINTPERKETTDQAKVVSVAPVIANTESLQKTVSSTPSTAPTYTFGKPKASATTSNSSLPKSSTTFTLTATTTPTSLSTYINFLPVDKTPSSWAFAPVNSSATTIQTNNIITTSATVISSTAVNTTQANSTFTFRDAKTFSSPVTIAQTTTPSLSSQSTGMMILPVKTTSGSIISAGFNSTASSTSNSLTTATSSSPPSFIFGSNGTVSQLPKSNSFMFGQSDSNIQSKVNTFRSPSNSQTTSLPPVTTKSFNFFTSNILATTAASNLFTNVASLATSTSTSRLSSVPVLSTSTTSSTATSSTSKPLFAFGTSNTSNATSTAAILPVTTANNITNFGAMKNNAVLTFGTSTTTITPQFSTSAITVPQFGVSTTSIFATTSNTTTSTNIFGTTSNSQSFFGTAPVVPGTTSIFNSPTTTVPSIFVTTTNAASSPSSTISSSLFANANANLTSTTAAPSMFGSGTPIFGQTKLSPSFGAASGMFGTATSPLFNSTTQAGTTASTFNITGNVSTGTITPGFDSTSNTTPAFGAPSVGTSQTTSSAFGGTTNMFGSTDKNTSVPIFGTNATPASGTFGPLATTSTFGTQNPTNLTFGAAASGGTMFGDNKSPFGATPATTTGFAGTSTSSSIPAFGASNANASNNTNNMFVFGNNQKDGQQNTTFPFGSNFQAGSNNSTAPSSTPFQFGPTAPKPAPTGFNFTTPQPATTTLNFGTSAAPTFNPSTPGMFSIGSGSTAPRSRTIRTRKPR
ncbi:nuclear pore complex protein DDB_G0274915-like isoform X2 [Formica exsecta]|uniref:nuclear pore complex protein DDB_G0274915-like isoform X2 n=1 Tax=Formica exsecta TaxID=72781 RepID=UPI00114151C6|nr:nuclear pore complex protein DDB_G0274915-like isoform X2 [Formica exsecta]